MPSRRNRVRLEWLAAATLWVTMRMVWPWAFRLSKTRRRLSEALESRAPVGSSARRIAGRVMRARPTAVRCFWPPESS